MPGVCLYFQVHQPCRLRHYTVFRIGRDHEYFAEEDNREILAKVAQKCYLPANRILHDLIRQYQGDFRVAFSLSGVALDQFSRYHPEVMDSFKGLADTGCVEFLNETYYHSLAFLYSDKEFARQVKLHQEKISLHFGQQPTTFRHTELIYNNELAAAIKQLGYRTILTEGADRILGWRSPNYAYQPANIPEVTLLLRNYRLSDDISFRFSNRAWSGFPLTADKYAHWLHQIFRQGDIINLFMDYETFGEHQWRETGIFDFLSALPGEILKHPDFVFMTPGEASREIKPIAELNIPEFISWADTERDMSAWQGNNMQKDAARSLYQLAESLPEGDERLMDIWGRLQTSDHFYYMCTKWFADGTVHKYFNPYQSPYDAYINYMNILDDFSGLIDRL
ncbi:MAG: glycoside hydrolase family 57 protein [Smithellaceae bacterium]|nr:glycoside hydrolase family 57 protein [Smithellaceae bacterium]